MSDADLQNGPGPAGWASVRFVGLLAVVVTEDEIPSPVDWSVEWLVPEAHGGGRWRRRSGGDFEESLDALVASWAQTPGVLAPFAHRDGNYEAVSAQLRVTPPGSDSWRTTPAQIAQCLQGALAWPEAPGAYAGAAWGRVIAPVRRARWAPPARMDPWAAVLGAAEWLATLAGETGAPPEVLGYADRLRQYGRAWAQGAPPEAVAAAHAAVIHERSEVLPLLWREVRRVDTRRRGREVTIEVQGPRLAPAAAATVAAARHLYPHAADRFPLPSPRGWPPAVFMAAPLAVACAAQARALLAGTEAASEFERAREAWDADLAAARAPRANPGRWGAFLRGR